MTTITVEELEVASIARKQARNVHSPKQKKRFGLIWRVSLEEARRLPLDVLAERLACQQMGQFRRGRGQRRPLPCRRALNRGENGEQQSRLSPR